MKYKRKFKSLMFLMSIILLIMSSCGVVREVNEISDGNLLLEEETIGNTDTYEIQEEMKSLWAWNVSRIELNGLELQAVTVCDDKIYFISNSILYRVELDGSNVEQIDTIDTSKLKFITFMCVDTNSNLWLAEIGGYICSYSMNGEKLSEWKLADAPGFWALRGGIFGLPTGKIGAITTSISGDYDIFAFDLSTDIPEKLTTLGSSITTGSKPKYAYANESELLIWNDEGIYTCELSGNYELLGNKENILKWDEVGIYGESLRVLGMSSENSIILMSDGVLYLLERIAKPMQRIKCEMKLAVVGYFSDELSKVVSDYNLSQDSGMIRIVQYENIQTLNAEIVAGNVPDLMITDSVPFDEYASKGIYEDLSPFLEECSEFTLLPSLGKALATNNKLYRITPAFMIMTMIASSDYVDNEMGWTFDEMNNQIKSGASPFPMNWNRNNALQFLVLQNISDYVDWENGNAYFDSADFKKMLEMVKAFPETNKLNLNDVEQVNNGKQLLLQRTLSSHLDFVMIDNDLGGKAVFKGFPGESKTVGTFFAWPFTVAMTSHCRDKEEAWKFIQFTLGSEYSQGFSAVELMYGQQEEKAMISEYVELKRNDIFDDITCMTTEQSQRFNDFLEQVTTLVEGNQVISEIITAEVNSYFLGHKTVDAVANLIQNRVNIYLQEKSN